jgi:hypothetical protein
VQHKGEGSHETRGRGHVACYTRRVSQYVVSLLAQRPAHELQESRDKARAEVARLTVEIEQIDQALAKQGQRQSRRSGPRGRRKGVSGGTRERVLDAVRSAPEDTITPAQIIAAVREGGAIVGAPAIRNMIRRLMDDDEIVRIREGVYKLASRNGSSVESNSGPTENGNRVPLLPVAAGP